MKSDVYICYEVGYIKEEVRIKYVRQIDKVKIMLNGLIGTVAKQEQKRNIK